MPNHRRAEPDQVDADVREPTSLAQHGWGEAGGADPPIGEEADLLVPIDPRCPRPPPPPASRCFDFSFLLLLILLLALLLVLLLLLLPVCICVCVCVSVCIRPDRSGVPRSRYGVTCRRVEAATAYFAAQPAEGGA